MPLGVFYNRTHPIFRNTARDGIVMLIMPESFTVKTIQPTKIGPQPQVLSMINMHTHNYIIREAVRIIDIMQVLFEASCLPIKIDQSATIGTDPDIAIPVFDKVVDVTERQTIRI